MHVSFKITDFCHLILSPSNIRSYNKCEKYKKLFLNESLMVKQTNLFILSPLGLCRKKEKLVKKGSPPPHTPTLSKMLLEYELHVS